MPDLDLQHAAREIRSAMRWRDEVLIDTLRTYDEATDPAERESAAYRLIGHVGAVEGEFTQRTTHTIGRLMLRFMERGDMPAPPEVVEQVREALNEGTLALGMIEGGFVIGAPLDEDVDIEGVFQQDENTPTGKADIPGIDPDFVREPERPAE